MNDNIQRSEIDNSMDDKKIDSFLICIFLHREKKRERERDDLWRKMQDLSLKNAAKEGISLGRPSILSAIFFLQNFYFRYDSNK